MQTRLYSKGRILGHKRGKRNSRPNQSLVTIEGVDSKEAARSYLGKVSLVLRDTVWCGFVGAIGAVGVGKRSRQGVGDIKDRVGMRR